jgi:hypothetical protein
MAEALFGDKVRPWNVWWSDYGNTMPSTEAPLRDARPK